MWATTPSLLTVTRNRKVSDLLPTQGPQQGTACQDLTQHGAASMAVGHHPSPRQAGIPGPQALPRGKTGQALQAAGAMDRLHIVNSFTLMEIPNAVWPRERIWSPFKGPSSEFPTLPFSYHLSPAFLRRPLQSCKGSRIEDGVGVKREGALPEQCIPYITWVMVL